MTEKRELIRNGKRANGREDDELRPIKITVGVLDKAQGSCLLEWGKNMVLAGVYGPREVFPKRDVDARKAILVARYVMAPFSGVEGHGRAGPNRRSREISKVAGHVFENVVLTEKFPKTMIEVQMEVLQSDGGTRIAAITAGVLALADAGIPMKDLPCGSGVGTIDEDNKRMVLDLDKYEDNLGKSDIPTILSPRTGEILLYQMDGYLTKEQLLEGLDKVQSKAVPRLREEMARALKEKYGGMAENGGVEQ
ncbi:exosome complex exonuclease Rrp41 [Candidatus Micrarchaeota archaeon CG_4_10_14_0_2_um_filter_55_9]|nr:MAG: exosome complex exonuclease Rrp41 [Candidatus Micrarchaeota archaeon CG1_02_55_41]PIO02865.1 MAG: exosome complex exonuclease Rrp41 [Candidatus Micrarchaeota archaeon CG09_land_8_20_14_0_10_55_25]PIZ91681.1 MAG: exosome complex exonuclease Rrp41 [Candidatus Micrarchaeota archaeon CG_4_10_14_0_2_um_filter_55_9]PJD01275.1 MAG: exosome complex exonuclease Rrp41 [Candidatus Micrarchaeota archaeon CG10_big_fil_rev_8_21_14_0_10_54_18]